MFKRILKTFEHVSESDKQWLTTKITTICHEQANIDINIKQIDHIYMVYDYHWIQTKSNISNISNISKNQDTITINIFLTSRGNLIRILSDHNKQIYM